MGIYRGPGGVGDATGDAASEAALAIAAAEEARVSANSAASSATSASNSATSSQGSADDANDSAIAAATSASSASVSATSASTSASNASTSATSAATSATNAATSESNTASLYDQFDDRYLGSKASNPTLDNDGNALLEGALYWNTGTKRLRIYNGTAWENTISTGSSGTVTSVDMSVPTGLQVSGNPITEEGTLEVSYQSGYSIPTTTKQGQWDTAYSWGDHAIVGYLDTADIGTTVQAYDADLTTLGAGGSTARSFLGLAIGTDVQAYDVDTTKNDVANTFTANQIISVTDNSNAALRVTQLGTGNAILIEDAANPDSSPVVVDASGNVGIGVTTTSVPLMVRRDQATDTTIDYWNATNNSAASVTQRFVTNNVAGTSTSTATITKAKTGAFSIKNNDASGFITLDTNSVERVRVTPNGGVAFGGASNYGSSGQVLQSNGDAAPTWTNPASGFRNMEVFTSSGTFNVPAGVTKIKATVVGGGGGSSSGGTSSIGSLASATGGAARVSGATLNAGGAGTSGLYNEDGCTGGFGVGINQGTVSGNRTAYASGGVSAFGLGKGTDYSRTQNIGNGEVYARGGAGGGGAIGVYTVTPLATITVTVGASGGGDNATSGVVIVEW